MCVCVGVKDSYLVADESRGARVRGGHFCAACTRIFLSPHHIRKKWRRKREGKKNRGRQNPSSPQTLITAEGRKESERVVLSLSASRLTLLRRLNSHFLYKIDALTAALAHTRPHTVTPEFSSGRVQPHLLLGPSLLLPSTASPTLFFYGCHPDEGSAPTPLMSLPVCRPAVFQFFPCLY